MNERIDKIKKLLNFPEEKESNFDKFDKDRVLLDIVNNLPENWKYYNAITEFNLKTLEEGKGFLCEEYSPYCPFDLMITTRKLVKEQRNAINPYSAVNSDRIYNINLGINIVNTKKTNKKYDNILATMSLDIYSCSQLLNILEEIDSEIGGVKPCKT